MSSIEKILRLMVDKKASDIYLSAQSPILIKINGQIIPVNAQLLPADAPRNLLAEVLPPDRIEELEATGELNTALLVAGLGNFRISGFRQRNTYAAVIRYVPIKVPELDSLNVPIILSDLVKERHGLILMVGASGSGKSTTMAAMIDYRNQTMPGHILTIEDPIEFLLSNKKSIVNQREVGRDTESLEVALKNALRQAPDVILIGEIRDRETMSAALSYAQSGYLCLASMHANNSYQALNRILSFYPVEVRSTMLDELSAALRAIVSQRLLRTQKGNQTPAVEVMINSRLVAELITTGEFSGVKEAMEKSVADGSQTFEKDLARLIMEGTVSRKEGLAYADSSTNLMWRLENDFTAAKNKALQDAEDSKDDEPFFTDITLDIPASPVPENHLQA